MKKMMIALAGIMSVMLIASCSNDSINAMDVTVLDTKQSYTYYLDVTGNISTTKSTNGTTTTVAFTPKYGSVQWTEDRNEHSNVKMYTLVIYDSSYSSKEFYETFYIIKYGGNYYVNDLNNTSLQCGNPESDSFSISGTYNGGTKIDLKFTRK